VLWGTVYLERVIQTLQNSDAGVDPDLLQHLSPLGWEHINLTGNYNLAKPHQARPLPATPARSPPLARRKTELKVRRRASRISPTVL